MVNKFFLVFLFFLEFGVHAHQPSDGKVYATLGPFIFRTHAMNHSFESPRRLGFGVLAEGDLNMHGGLEVGGFYLPKYFSVKDGDQVITERAQKAYITLGYRYWPFEFWSFGLGFFSCYAMGDAQEVHSDYGSSSHPKTSAEDITDYGIDASMQFERSLSSIWSFVADMRYSYSLTPHANEDSNHYGLILALKYLVQENK